MDPTIKTLRGKPLTLLIAMIAHYPDMVSVEKLAAVTGYRRERIPAGLKILDAAGLIKRYHRSAWTLIHSPAEIVETICKGDKMSQSMLHFVTLSSSQETRQSDKMSQSMLQNVTLNIHDHDHDDDGIIKQLIYLGFTDANQFYKKYDPGLIYQWLQWEKELDRESRKRFRNIGGYIRRAVKKRQAPPAITSALPAEYKDIVIR